jgi:hypothetical protein
MAIASRGAIGIAVTVSRGFGGTIETGMGCHDRNGGPVFLVRICKFFLKSATLFTSASIVSKVRDKAS